MTGICLVGNQKIIFVLEVQTKRAEYGPGTFYMCSFEDKIISLVRLRLHLQ